MDTDVPGAEPMDTDTAPSFAIEFEKLLLQKHCWELIDETHHVQRIFHYGCQCNPPGQLGNVCVTDWEDKKSITALIALIWYMKIP